MNSWHSNSAVRITGEIEMSNARQQMISNLSNCSDATADRINDRLQQCNVRICREDGGIESSSSIRTRQQLIYALQNDSTIKSVQYLFNQEWTTAQA
jgi:seryl-tRNA(Sec) selenium transferase